MERYIYSKHGWLSTSAQWNTDRTKAARFPLEEAIDRCNAYRINSLTAVPVNPADMGRIK